MLAQDSVPPIEEIDDPPGRSRRAHRGARRARRQGARSRPPAVRPRRRSSRGRCRRSATGCTCPASACGRSNRARRTSCAALRAKLAQSHLELIHWRSEHDALSAVRRHRLEARRRSTGVAPRRPLRLLARAGRPDSGSPARTSRSAISTARSPTSPPTTSRSRRRSARARRVVGGVSRRQPGACCSKGSPASARRISRSPC